MYTVWLCTCTGLSDIVWLLSRRCIRICVPQLIHWSWLAAAEVHVYEYVLQCIAVHLYYNYCFPLDWTWPVMVRSWSPLAFYQIQRNKVRPTNLHGWDWDCVLIVIFYTPTLVHLCQLTTTVTLLLLIICTDPVLPKHIPNPCSIAQYFGYCADIRCIPKKVSTYIHVWLCANFSFNLCVGTSVLPLHLLLQLGREKKTRGDSK